MTLCSTLCPRPRLLRSTLVTNDYDMDVSSTVGTSELVVDIVFASAVARLGKGLQRALVAAETLTVRDREVREAVLLYIAGFTMFWGLWMELLNYSTRFAQDSPMYRAMTFCFMAPIVAAIAAAPSLQHYALCSAAAYAVLFVAYLEVYTRTPAHCAMRSMVVRFARLKLCGLAAVVAALGAVCALGTARRAASFQLRAVALIAASLLSSATSIVLVVCLPQWMPRVAEPWPAPCYKRRWCASATGGAVSGADDGAVPPPPAETALSRIVSLLPLHLSHFSDRLG